MATIGTFTKSGNEFKGSIITLSVQAKNVRIVPEDNSGNDKAPSHRLLAGDVAFGPPGRRPAAKVATISRSSSTIRASPLRSMRASPRMKMAA